MRHFILSTLLLLITIPVCAVPVSPRLLREALEQGDTARYEQLLRRSAIANSRHPKHPLVERARRAQAEAPARQFGVTPLVASRGLLILVNYSDKSFLATNTQAQMDSMMNAYNYTYNGATGSAAQYYCDQSLGQYRPHFDVVGPITLPKPLNYYGENGTEEGDDLKCGDLVLHACSIASQIDGVNLADYDQDGDGEMDFVYILYAGKGEADGGAANTIWPASWDMASAVEYGATSLSKYANKSQYTFDGVAIGNFAYSSELDGSTGKRNGIGTPTHEFGHVLGLPDLYDIEYGSNYNNSMTPGEWDIMDGGSYNNDGRTPPNMSPWEKAFMGWITPVNAGTSGRNLTLYANGTEDYNVYQLNASGTYQDYKTSGVCYYIENRQQTGWDAYVPGHGMVIWKLNYNQSVWEENGPNATTGNCRYTVVSATGRTTKIGSAADPFPGSGNKTTWSGLSGKPLTEIHESNGIVTCKYMGGQTCEGYSVTFVSTCATMTADDGYDEDCITSGMGFDGTFTIKNGYVYDSVVVTMGGVRLSEDNVDYIADATGISIDAVTDDVVITLYGHRDGNASFMDCDEYSWTASQALSSGENTLGNWSWTLAMTGSTYLGYDTQNSQRGVQFGSKNNPASLVSLTTEEAADCMIEKVVVSGAMGSQGTGNVSVFIDGEQVGSTQNLAVTTKDYTFTNADELQGTLEIRYTNSAKALYLKGIQVTFLPAPPMTAVENTTVTMPARKRVVNGQLLILREGKTYNLFGQIVE